MSRNLWLGWMTRVIGYSFMTGVVKGISLQRSLASVQLLAGFLVFLRRDKFLFVLALK